MDRLEITITKWAEYNPRFDAKRPSWFRFQWDFFHSPHFEDFTNDERAVWVFLCCRACQLNCGTFLIKIPVLEAKLQVSDKVVFSTIEKLEREQIISVARTESCETRTESAPARPLRTDVRTYEQEPKKDPSSADALPLLARLWNQYAGSLPKVRGCSTQRKKNSAARWKENPSEEYWTNIIRKIASSAFCNGASDRKWKAGFDWLLQPEVQHKVLEGKYDSGGQTAGQLKTVADLRAEFGDLP